MIRNHLHRTLMACTTVLLLAACQDQVTAPDPAVTDLPSRTTLSPPETARHDGRGGPAVCSVTRSHPDGREEWQSRAVTIHFPRSEVRADGATVPYTYRGYRGAEVAATATCLIPRTDAAQRRVDRIFQVGRGESDSSHSSVMSVESCGGEDNPCPIDVVIGYGCVGGGVWPDCNGVMDPGDHEACSVYNECGGGSGWTGTPWTGGAAPAAAPDGVSQDLYNTLNEAERRLCWRNPFDCNKVRQAKNAAEAWAPQQTSVGAHNGPQDALRHAMWNAEMTVRMDAVRAKTWADAHEQSSTNVLETRMDLHNNAVGRAVGQNHSDLGAGVLEAWRNGQLCTAVGSC
jgi:hypothetical protein